MVYRVRTVRAEEWPRLKALRLEALADPVAPVAFLESHERAAAYPDSLWQQRAAEGGGHADKATFIGEEDHEDTVGERRWAGMVVVLDEGEIARMVGVYLRPEHRGTGLASLLFDIAARWAWARPDIRRVLLHVHENNPRAEAFYRRLGFRRTGVVDSDLVDSGPRQYTFNAYEMELLRPR